MWGWRSSDRYRYHFRGKPAYMSEAEYYQAMDKLQTRGPDVLETMRAYGDVPLWDENAALRMIFLGGPGTAGIRESYARAQRRKASYDTLRGRSRGAKVKETPLGPIQPTMRGTNVAATRGRGITPELKTDIFSQTYSDFKEGSRKTVR